MNIDPILEFLRCRTPDAWVQWAISEQELMLIDHANCEKKAAGTALNLMYKYIDNFELLNKMSRLAREELRHFEQVIGLMEKRNIAYKPVSASRYAAELRKPIRTHEPARLVDTLIVGSIIEARSCERFEKIAPLLDEELERFYVSLLKSESRHFKDYLGLAQKVAGDEPIQDRVDFFLDLEQKLILEEDKEFRFHSGIRA